MASGETILKLSDYPFAYSILALLFNTGGLLTEQYQILFLGLAGGLGTFLTFLDPVGEIIKNRASSRINNNQSEKSSQKSNNKLYQLSSLKSRAITFEIEKIIGLVYFILIIFTFGIIIVLSIFVAEITMFDIIKDNGICEDDGCIQVTTTAILTGVFIFLFFRGRKFWQELDGKIELAGTHQMSISSEYPTTTSLDNFTRAIEQNDWEIAKIWSNKVTNEIKIKKGKRDVIIKSAETIFRPLHVEANVILNELKKMKAIKHFSAISTSAWGKIREESAHVMIIDTELRKRISDFYESIEEFNEIVDHTNDKVGNYIREIATKEFSKRVTNIVYNVLDSKQKIVQPGILNSIMFDIHPSKAYPNTRVMEFHLRNKPSPGGSEQKVATYTPASPEFKKFDSFWAELRKKVNGDEDVIRIRQTHEKLLKEADEIQLEYQNMIKLQWEV